MPDSTVIQEFLVSLGFRLDDSQRQKFDAAMAGNRAQAAALNKTLADVGKQLGVLGDTLVKVSQDPTRRHLESQDKINRGYLSLATNVKALAPLAIATAGTFVAGLATIAREYDRLYYISQRTGESAQQLSALRFVGPQVGLGSDSLVAATEAIATATRNPGMRAFLNSWGIADNDVMKFIGHIRSMPPYLQDAYAQMFGVSTTFVRNVVANWDITQKAQEDFNRRAREAGINYGETTQKAVDVTRDLEGVWSRLGMIATKGFDEAYPSIEKLLKGTNDLLDAVSRFNAVHPGAALAENLAAAAVSAAGVLAILGQLSGLPLLRFGIGGALLYGAEEGGRHFTEPLPKAIGGIPRLPGPTDVYLWLREMITGKAAGAPLPPYAAGGTIRRTGPILAHAGETIIPTQGGNSFEVVNRALLAWLSGSTAYRPFVQIAGTSQYGGQPGGTGAGGGIIPVNYSPSDAGGRMVGGGGLVSPITKDILGVSGFTDPRIKAAFDVIDRAESGGRNVNNFMYNRPGAHHMGPGGVEVGYTAGGYHQMLDTNWVKYARRLGIDTAKYPRAISAPKELQDAAAQLMFQTEGPRPWLPSSGGAARLALIQRAMAAVGVSGGDGSGGHLPVMSPDYVFGKNIPRPDPNSPWFGGSPEPARYLAGKYHSTLGGHTIVSNDAGDHHTTVNQTNHITVGAGHNVDEAGRQMVRHLNDHSGRLLRNAQMAIE